MQTRVEQGVTTTYTPDTTHKHAVKQAGSNYFCYDANGNITKRNATSAACSNGDALSYDVENRLTQVIKGSTTTNFAYNGNGTRVKRQVVGMGTTYYIGNYYEVYKPDSGTTTFNKYYYFGAQRVAAKIGATLFYMQGDHLGSSSLVMTSAGALNTRQTYYPFGAQRTTDGSTFPTGMDYTFTGQKNDDSTGLMFYGARYYDTSLGRFTQPDTIVPNPLNPQAFNRYSYGYNNPVRYLDPTGHIPCEDQDDCNPGQGGDDQPTGEIPDPNVPPPGGGEPQAQPGYCDQNPYANGCVDLPVSDDSSSDDCNIANCDKPEGYSQDNPPPQLYCKTIHWSGLCDELYGGNDRWGMTMSIGLMGAYCQIAACGSGDVTVNMDDNGYFAFSTTPSGYGSTSQGWSFGPFLMFTNALGVNDLAAKSANFGGSYTPAGEGMGIDILHGANGPNSYWGLKVTDLTAQRNPLGMNIPGEVHIGGGYTIMQEPVHISALMRLLGFDPLMR